MNQKHDSYNVTNIAVPFDIRCRMDVHMLPMHDGIKLHTIVYFPTERPERCPVMIVRTPYTQTTQLELPRAECLESKRIYILQACRGTGWSEGVFDPAKRDTEMSDADALFKWLTEEPWFNGRCVMLGASYPGWTQWCAQRTGFKGLVGIAPRVAPLFSCIGSPALGGGVQLSFSVNWMLSMYHRRTYGYAGVPSYENMRTNYHLPVVECDRQAGYVDKVVPFQNFIAPAACPATTLLKHQNEFERFHAPAFVSGGWFDDFKEETIESFQRMKHSSATTEARAFSRLTIGPWGHGGLLNPEFFGGKCNYDELNDRQEKFLNGLLDDPLSDPLPKDPAVRFYMLGENRWHDASDWPPPGTRYKPMYLHSGGNANSSSGDGFLDWNEPEQEMSDSYISDPNEPMLSNRGQHAALGYYDRSEDEKRGDVLVYTTAPIREPLTVTGEIKLNFFASVSTPDTDFCALLTDVMPDGRAMILTYGMVRARFRHSLEQEDLLLPHKIYKFEISLSHTAVKFMPRHALRLEICGQYFPCWDRNANSGGPVLQDRELHLSRHTIYHDSEHPARLLLPVENF